MSFEKIYDWAAIQKAYDADGHLYKDLKRVFGVTIGGVQKAIRRGDFTPRSVSESAKIRDVKTTRKHSEATKRKISKSRIKFLNAHPDQSPYLLSHASKKSYTEQLFETALVESGIDGWVYNYQAGRFQYDFAFPKRKLDVEIDGGTHRLPHVKKIDRRRDAWSKKQGWTVLRFTATEVKTNIVGCLNKLRERL